ncbi:MAG: M55 family metallopeptidase [Bacteroidetes bacterium]|nr:M55 family metallopeptidase [Bacteroidota bacterium]
MRTFLLYTFLFAFSLSAAAQSNREGLKIYISADMEGLTGAVTGEQLGPTGFEYARFRQIMTDEVNAVISAAREEGATEFLVSDSHGNGQNLLIEQLPDDVQIVRSWPRALGMMHGIDETFDGVIFVGYHSSTSNSEGVRAHTKSSANLTDLQLNGEHVSEGSWNAAIAGHFNVPVILVTGDDAAVAEVSAALGPIEGAVVKMNHGFHSATTMTPAAGQKLIREKTRAAIRRISEFKPFKLYGPPVVQFSLKHYQPAELLAYLKFVRRVDSHTIEYLADDMIDASKFMQFVLDYSVTINP